MAVPEKSLPQVIGEMTVLWNDCQAVVFALFFLLLGAPLPKAKSVFFSIPSDLGQRRATQALIDSGTSDIADRAWKAIEAFGKMGGARNAFIHAAWDFPEGSSVARNWQDTWKDDIGGHPVKKCLELIGRLEIAHINLTNIERELRKALSTAQGGTLPEPLPLPLRQSISPTANEVSRSQRQHPGQALSLQHQQVES